MRKIKGDVNNICRIHLAKLCSYGKTNTVKQYHSFNLCPVETIYIGVTHIIPETDKHWPVGPIQPTTCLCRSGLQGTQPAP